MTFSSPIFRMFNSTWCIKLYPNGTGHPTDRSCDGTFNMYAHLLHRSQNIKSMKIRRKYTFLEANIIDIQWTEVLNEDDYLTTGWPTGTLKTSRVQKYEQFTIMVCLELLCAYDTNDKDITDELLPKQETQSAMNDDEKEHEIRSLKHQIQRMKQTQKQQEESINKMILNVDKIRKKVNDIVMRINEEEKGDDERFDKIMDEIKLLKQGLKSLSVDGDKHNMLWIDPEKQKLRSWLNYNVKLPEYYDIFIENAIDSLDTVRLLTLDGIKGMGIDKVGHQMKILYAIKVLNQNNDCPCCE